MADPPGLLDLLARASSPQERLGGGWLQCGGPDPARFAAWVGTAAGGRVDRAAAILVARGIAAEAWERALGPATAVPGKALPHWARAVSELVALAGTPAAHGPVPTLGEITGGGLPDWVDPAQPWRFHPLFAAWLQRAGELVDQWFAEAGSTVPGTAAADLRHWLARRMLGVAGPTLMSVGVPELPTDAPTAVRDWWLRLWERYPVLARLLGVVWLQWQDAAAQVVNRIAADLPALAGSQVARITPGAGDQHAGGRSVVVVELVDGRKLYGKPYPDAVTPLVADLLGELDRIGPGPLGLTVPRAHHKPDWTWTEEVPAGECPDAAAVASWYFRAGALLGVLWALGATDAHHENLIATAEGPVLVDLETALAPAEATGDGDAMAAALAASPTATSMLSAPVDGRPGQASCDIGGLAAPSQRVTPYEVSILVPGAADGRLERAAVPLQTGTALPRLAGSPVPPAQYAADVAAGMSEVGSRLARLDGCSDVDVRAEHAAAASQAQAGVRFVPRPTQLYARLLAASLSRDALADGVARELVLERLWLGFGAAHTGLIGAEQDSLRDLDVPRFTVPLAAADRIIGPAGQAIPHSFAASPLANAGARIRAAADPQTQGVAVAAALAGLFAADPPPAPARPPDLGRGPMRQVDRPHIVGVPERRTKRAAPPSPTTVLARAAVTTPDGPGWVGLDYDPSRARWAHGQLSPGLLGVAGIGLALVLRGDAAERELGAAALLGSATRIRRRLSWTCQDAHTGVSGVVWALAVAGTRAHDPSLVAAARDLLPLAVEVAQAAADGGIPAGYSMDAVAGAVLAARALPIGAAEVLDQLRPLVAVPVPRHRGRPCDAAASWGGTLPSAAGGRELARAALGLPPEPGSGPEVAVLSWGDACAEAALGRLDQRTWTQLSRAAGTPGGLLELAQVASAGAAARAPGPWQARLQVLRSRIQVHARSAGRWFPDAICPDPALLSAVHGVAGLAILGLGMHAPYAADVNVRILR